MTRHSRIQNQSSVQAPVDGPISWLAHELLAMIFTHAQSEIQHGKRDKSERHVPCELVVSHVSTLWRDVVTNTPSMWSNINLSGHYELIQIYLSRSKAYPLDVLIDHEFRVQSYTEVTTISDIILDEIVLHVHRLRSLHVMGLVNDIYATLSRFRDLAAPLLRE